MKVLITGAAGFIGSQLSRRWLERGAHVVGIDAFTDYYSPDAKIRNVEDLRRDRDFELVAQDILDALADILDKCDIVYHQAAQPGVRASWPEFETYVRHNILATQKLLDAALGSSISRFVYASSSSVYGNPDQCPTREDAPLRPHSPYGVTKLAAENLVSLYARNFGLPTTSLRYFTVYGPGQRPDMAINRLIAAAITGRPFPLFGDGSAIRDFTYIEDVVQANIRAGTVDVPSGSVINVAGGASISIKELITLVGRTVGRPVPVDQQADKAGDVAETGGDITRARDMLDWTPKTNLEQGIAEHVQWQQSAPIVASDK